MNGLVNGIEDGEILSEILRKDESDIRFLERFRKEVGFELLDIREETYEDEICSLEDLDDLASLNRMPDDHGDFDDCDRPPFGFRRFLGLVIGIGAGAIFQIMK